MAHRDGQCQQDIRNKATRITDTLKQANQQLYEAEGLAVAALEELNSQNEHLDQINDKADSVDAKIQYANKQAKYLKKGWLRWMVSSEPKMKEPKCGNGAGSSGSRNDNTPEGVQERMATRVQGPAGYDALDTKALQEQGHGALVKELELHDREYNDGLDEMSRNLERLTHMGLAIGEELDSSSSKIDQIHTKVSKNHDGLNSINTKLRTIK